MLNFWEGLAKIEKAYAKSIEELCQSRQAKLQRIFQKSSVEPLE